MTQDQLMNDYAALEAENARLIESFRLLRDDATNKLGKIEQENDALKAKVERLTAPVTDEEWLDLCAGDHVEMAEWMQRADIERLIAARSGAEPDREMRSGTISVTLRYAGRSVPTPSEDPDSEKEQP